jgi:TPP-dependent pyruvate/acetoin dehydrogenase alpha subunit
MWKARDPIARFRQQLIDQQIMTDADAEAMDAAVQAQVDQAQADADAAPYPAPEHGEGPVYAV